jgi:hypothetical protein
MMNEEESRVRSISPEADQKILLTGRGKFEIGTALFVADGG